MVDGFARLGHDAIIRRNHHDNYVGHLGSPCPHGRKSFVARCIQEGNLLARFGFDAIGADVLGDTTCLAAGNISRTNIVQQGCFTVVDVAHDGHDGGSLHQILRSIHLFHHFVLNFFLGRNEFHLKAKFIRNEGNGLGINPLVDGYEHAHIETYRNHFLHRNIHQRRQLVGRDKLRNA